MKYRLTLNEYWSQRAMAELKAKAAAKRAAAESRRAAAEAFTLRTAADKAAALAFKKALAK